MQSRVISGNLGSSRPGVLRKRPEERMSLGAVKQHVRVRREPTRTVSVSVTLGAVKQHTYVRRELGRRADVEYEQITVSEEELRKAVITGHIENFRRTKRGTLHKTTLREEYEMYTKLADKLDYLPKLIDVKETLGKRVMMEMQDRTHASISRLYLGYLSPAGHHRDAGSDARGAGAVSDGPQDGAANLHGGGRHRRQPSARPARKDAQGARLSRDLDPPTRREPFVAASSPSSPSSHAAARSPQPAARRPPQVQLDAATDEERRAGGISKMRYLQFRETTSSTSTLGFRVR